MRLDDVKGFVLDIDGTLVHREGKTMHVQPGAVEALDRIRASGRPFVLFTNGAHVPSRQLRCRGARGGPRRPRRRGADAARQRPVPSADASPRACDPRLSQLVGAGAARAGRRPLCGARRSGCRCGVRRARQRGGVRRPRARGPCAPRRRRAPDCELRRVVRGRERPDLLPRRDGHRRARKGVRRRADRSSASPPKPRSKRSATALAYRRKRSP